MFFSMVTEFPRSRFGRPKRAPECPNTPRTRTERAYDPLRDDPRFQDLMRRMNLMPSEWWVESPPSMPTVVPMLRGWAQTGFPLSNQAAGPLTTEITSLDRFLPTSIDFP